MGTPLSIVKFPSIERMPGPSSHTLFIVVRLVINTLPVAVNVPDAIVKFLPLQQLLNSIVTLLRLCVPDIVVSENGTSPV